MDIEPHLPVIVGVGQMLRRPQPDDLPTIAEPVDMMAEVLEAAAADAFGGENADAHKLLKSANSVRVVDLLSWRYVNPALAVAQRVGAAPRQTMRTTTGGNSPQMLVNATAAAIQRGELDVALIAGAEAVYTRLLARKAEAWLPWTPQPEGTAEPEVIGTSGSGVNDAETARSLVLPPQIYPLFENALRAAAQESIDQHQVKISELWARFSEIGAGNPYAWSTQPRTAEEIRTATADNRMIAFPYPKYMNANIQTDQAAALIMCSAGTARSLGIPSDRWVFVHAGADAHDHWFVSERTDLISSPAIGVLGRTVLDLTGIGIDDIGAIDIYSCFPAAVQIGAAELDVGLFEADRPLTVTGGLAFAGGPGNNYVTHSIAAMVSKLRSASSPTWGLVTALGWYLTKHAVGVYSTTPPKHGFRWDDGQAAVEAKSSPRPYVAEWEGPVVVESYTVTYERDGSPALGIIACALDGGARAWGNVRDGDVLQEMTTSEYCGRAAVLKTDGLVDFG